MEARQESCLACGTICFAVRGSSHSCRGITGDGRQGVCSSLTTITIGSNLNLNLGGNVSKDESSVSKDKGSISEDKGSISTPL